MVGCTISAAPALRTGEECRGSVSGDGMRHPSFRAFIIRGHCNDYLYHTHLMGPSRKREKMAKNGHQIPKLLPPES